MENKSLFNYLRFLILSIVLMSFSFSSSQNNSNTDEVEKVSTNHKWMQAINKKDLPLLETLYTEKALVLSENGADLSSREEILKLVAQSDFEVKDVTTIKRIKAHQSYDYEIGRFKNKDGNLMKHFIVWNTADNKEVREIEFLAEAKKNRVDIDKIKNQREQWMALCNAHNAKTLIETMYTENTMYYNRGRLLQGRDQLSKEYQYMNNPQYTLKLEPILVEPVSDSIVYEFGQCVGSYNGKYVLIWQKNSEGIWQIIFDTNI
jgi:ketosteroid isomerase-like protein